MIMTLLALARRVPGLLPLKAWIAVGVLVLFLGFGGYCAQKAVQGERDRQAAEQAKTERRASAARETASSERLNDQTTLDQQRKLTDDALAPLPDAVPSDRRRLRHCLRLQRDRINTSFPECSRLNSQAASGS